MFRQILAVQWKFSRNALAALSVLVALLPALTMRLSVVATINQTPRGLVMFASGLGFCLALLAVLTGGILFETTWRNDTNGKYVYLLSMPITWRRFMLSRLAGGLLLLFLPAICLWIGSVIGTAFVPLPPTLHTYPAGIAIRFFLASTLAFCLWSALVHFSGQRATLVVLLILLVVITVPIVFAVAGISLPTDTLFRWIADPPSPISVLFSRWALIDV